MKENKQGTELKLSQSQLQCVINTHIVQGDGLNELFNMLLNGLMYIERKIFLSDSQTEGNKGNGYRFATKSGIGSKQQQKIPRNRLGIFRPVILGLLNEQEEQVNDLCFELYGKDNSNT